MKKQIYFCKRVVAFAVATVMALNGMGTVAAENQEISYSSEGVDLGEAGSLDNTEITDSTVTLKEGNYVEWIDRIDVPQEMYDFYEVLEEGTDGDGEKDILISEMEDNSYIPVITVQQTTEISETKINYIYNCIQAVWDAFNRDHPEVF